MIYQSVDQMLLIREFPAMMARIRDHETACVLAFQQLGYGHPDHSFAMMDGDGDGDG